MWTDTRAHVHGLVTQEHLLLPASHKGSTADKIIIFYWNSVFTVFSSRYVSSVIANHDFKRPLSQKEIQHFGLILKLVFYATIK